MIQKLIIAIHNISFFNDFSNVYVHIACMLNKKEKINNNIVVGNNETRKENVVLARKKYAISDMTRDTILPLFNNAIVRIDATVKIFSLRNTEYKPTANNVVRI